MCAAVKLNRFSQFDLNPRGNLWLNDENRFGLKLLSKMGWSQGKGLGKNEDGIKENLKVKMNSENRGIGWKQKFPLEVETAEYDALLADLNEKHNSSSNKKSDQENETSKIEKRPQELKIRRYGKFVRAKDVSRYSEKDFNSIFVTKMPKSKSKPVEESSITNVECPEECPESTTTFKSSVSMKDYFEMKMKNKAKTTADIEDMEVEEHDTPNEVSDHKKNRKKKRKSASEESSCEDLQDIKLIEEESNVEEHTPKRKKSKKGSEKSKKIKLDPDLEKSLENDEDEDIIQVCEVINLDDCTDIKESRKKKKSKRKSNKAKAEEIHSELREESSNKTVENDESTVEASQCEIVTLDDSLNYKKIEESSEGVDKVAKKRKQKKSKESPMKVDASDDSTSSSSSKEGQMDTTENSTLRTSEVSDRKKLKATRCKKSKGILIDLKTCLKNSHSYSVEKEARRVSFSEQVLCRSLIAHSEEGEVKSEITDVILPCADTANGDETDDKNENVGETDDKKEEAKKPHDKSKEIEVEEATEEGSAEEETESEVVKVEDATPKCLVLPKADISHYNTWLESQKVASRMKVYKNMVNNIRKHKVLKTTNLWNIKGYGNWGF